jgi:small subunit ribosomal protein S17
MTETNSSESETKTRGLPKQLQGIVASDKMDKTVVVQVVTQMKHPQYGKYVQRTKKYYAHDETNNAKEGDTVRITETRPLSKTKRYRVSEVVERAK